MSHAKPPGLSKHRIESLSDGIFAFAMTLLVLDLKVPEIASGLIESQLREALWQMWPKFLVYVMGFLVLGVYWVAQHAQFHFIKRADRPFLWINIMFLLVIAFIPFAVALLGAYELQRPAQLIYGGTLAATSLLQYVRWRYATDHLRLTDELPEGLLKIASRGILKGLAFHLAGMAAAFIHPVLALVIFAFYPFYFISPGLSDRFFTAHHTKAPQPDA